MRTFVVLAVLLFLGVIAHDRVPAKVTLGTMAIDEDATYSQRAVLFTYLQLNSFRVADYWVVSVATGRDGTVLVADPITCKWYRLPAAK